MNFADVRSKYPQYDDLSDDQLASALHNKFYSDIPFEEFSNKVGLRPAVDQSVLDPNDVRAKRPAPAAPSATGTQKAWASMPGRFLQGGVDVIDAGAQMLSRLGGSGEAARVDAMVKERGNLYEQAKRASGFDGADIARPVGSAALQMLALRGLPTTAATMPGKIGLGAAQGAAFGALQPVTEGDSFAAEKAKQAALGGATGAIAAPVAEMAAKVINPAARAIAEPFKREGIRLTPGQMLGGLFKTAEEKAQSLPVIGQSISAAKQRGVEDLNRAAVQRSLTPVGEKLPKGLVGHEAIAFADETLGKKYSEVLEKIGSIGIDDAAISDFNKIGGSLQSIPKDKQEQFVRILKIEVADRMQNGQLSADALKAAESNLGKQAKAYQRSDDYDVRKLGDALGDSLRAVRSLIGRQAPQHAADLQATNAGWANFKRAQKASSSVAAEDGVFTPAQLHNAVKAADRSKDKAAFARGDALMQDLSGTAKKVMQDEVRNSGTADRAASMGLLLALREAPLRTLAALPLAIPPMMAYSRPGVAAAEALLTSRPQVAQPLAEIVRRSALPLSAPFYPAAYGLLNGGQ